MKSLFLIPNLEKNLNYIALDKYLKMGYIPGDQCIIEGFNKLPPAHYAHFDLKNGKFEQFQYWNIPDFESNNVLAEQEILSELEERTGQEADMNEDSESSFVVSIDWFIARFVIA